MKDKLDGKIKAILFDLDGTLLDVDLDKFIPQYLKLLAQSVAHIINPKKFISKIMMASKAVEENNGTQTNDNVYTEICFNKRNGTHDIERTFLFIVPSFKINRICWTSLNTSSTF